MPFGLGLGELVFTSLVLSVIPGLLLLIPAWRVVSKAGYAGAWSLLVLVPVVNLAAFYLFAFASWPIDHRVHRQV